jgi:hypothetical protein
MPSIPDRPSRAEDRRATVRRQRLPRLVKTDGVPYGLSGSPRWRLLSVIRKELRGHFRSVPFFYLWNAWLEKK